MDAIQIFKVVIILIVFIALLSVLLTTINLILKNNVCCYLTSIILGILIAYAFFKRVAKKYTDSLH